MTTLFLAASCSSPAPHAEQSAPGHGQEIRATSHPSADPDHSLAVAAAPAATATATAGPAGSGRQAHKTALTVSSYDSRTRHAVLAK